MTVRSGGVFIHNGTSGSCLTITSATLQFNSGGKLTLQRLDGNIPTSAWDTGSICEVAYGGTGDGAKQATSALVQNFADFTVNCPLNVTGWDFAGQLTNHVGNFSVTTGPNPGATELKLFSGGLGNLNIGGNFNINSGSVNIGSSGGPWSITLTSNLTVAAGADLNISGSATPPPAEPGAQFSNAFADKLNSQSRRSL